MKVVSCNLCGSDDRRLLFTGRDYEVLDNSRLYQMHACNRCGLAYLSPRPDTEEELAVIYPLEYASYMTDRQRVLVSLRRLAWQPELREIVGMTDEVSSILELGCATGEFLAALRAKGRPQVQGVEFNPAAAAVARQRHKLDVHAGDLLEAKLQDSTFDVVVLRHVLEHVPDPRATLQEIQRVLRPGGHCIFTIPNIDSDTARLFGATWYGWTLPRHLYGFSRNVVTKLAHQAGLRVKQIKYSAAPNFWIGSVRYWLIAHGSRRMSRFFRYENPLAVTLFAPLGLVSALLKSSGTIRVITCKA